MTEEFQHTDIYFTKRYLSALMKLNVIDNGARFDYLWSRYYSQFTTTV